MTEHKTAPKLVELTGCRGRLWEGNDSADATFDVSVDRCGRTWFRMTPEPLERTNSWLLGAGDSRGRFVKALSFEGKAPNGRHVNSEYLYVTRWGSETSMGATTVSVDGALSHLLITPSSQSSESATAAGAAVKYLVPNVLGFREQPVTTSSGKLTFRAQTRLDIDCEVSGALVIEAAEGENRPLKEWLESCERECGRMLEILSLVEGRLFTPCARDVWCGETWVRTDVWEAPAPGPAAEPLWYTLNLQPFIELAVRSYSDELRESRGLDVAIGWFFGHSSYVEVKLTTVQAALEYMVACFEGSRSLSGSALSKDLFVTHVRPRLEEAIDAAVRGLDDTIDTATLETAAEVFRARIGGMNALTIRERLFRMLDADAVPYAGLEDAIKAAISARGGTVHGRKAEPDASRVFTRHIAVLRELVKRIILTLLGYRGRYISYLNGVEDVEFPPTAPTVVKE